METIKPVETTYSLPSSGNLLRKTQEYTSTTIVSPVDKMMIDEPYETEETQVSPLSENKPHLPSINSIQPFSPIPHNSTTTSDEYLRHRMSDMSMSAINNNSNNNNNNNNNNQHPHSHPSHTSIPLGRSSSHHSSTDPSSETGGGGGGGGGPYDPIKSSLSPLEPNNNSNHYYDGNGLPSFSRRGSLANPNASSPLDYRRPSITELNSLPLPNTAPLPTLSRRDSVVTTNSDYEDPLSRSPSPSPFKQSAYSHSHHPLQRASPPRELDLHPHHPLHHPHHLSNNHDTFQRRHSIATVEPTYPSSSSRLLSKHHRPFQFPDTIHESTTTTTTTATSDNNNHDKYDHGIYSAPSSPPGINNTNNNSNSSSSSSHHSYHPLHPLHPTSSSSSSSRYTRNYNMRQASSSSINESTYQQHHSHHPLSTSTSSSNNSNQHQRSHHPYPHPYANSYSRRRSIMNDEDIPQLARRASMPVVNVGRPSTNHPHYSHQPISSSHPGGEPFDSHPHSNSSSSYHDLLLDHPHSHHHDTLRKEKSPTTPTTSLSSSTINGNNANASSNRKSETPYSRSPELRISHKLAERKRRKEMKELFDELRDSLPVEKNLKTSKWEILSKAVEYIGTLKRRDYEKENEVNNLRLEIARLKHERSGSLTY